MCWFLDNPTTITQLQGVWPKLDYSWTLSPLHSIQVPLPSQQLLFFKNIEKELFIIDWRWFFFLKSKTSWLWHLSHHTYQTIFLPATDLLLCSLASFLNYSGFLSFIILQIIAQINTKLGLKTSLTSFYPLAQDANFKHF